MNRDLIEIAQHFQIRNEILEITPLSKGNICENYIINTNNKEEKYHLQRKNKNVFVNIPGMMQNIDKVTKHLKEKIIREGGNPFREALTLVKTKDDKLFYQDELGEYWAISYYINDHLNFELANTPELAYANGKGIGKFQAMLSDFPEPLADTLPGYHNIKFRFEQWEKTLAADPLNRSKELKREIRWIEERKESMMDLWLKIDENIIPRRVAHNDAKISNILFNKNHDVLCVIDLDTVMKSTVLFDFGDAIRSAANTGEEDDPNLDNVNMDINIFKSFSEGYISQVKTFISGIELENLAFAARYITYEQAMRFLMDYIDGDTYYKIKSQEHNLVRARAQFKMLQSIEQQLTEMDTITEQLAHANNIC